MREPSRGALPQAAARAHRGARGFTLLELLIVIFLLGMTLAIIAPTFQEISGTRLRSATRTLAGTVRFVHGQASSTRSVYRLELDLDRGRFWVSRCVPVTDGTCEWEVDRSNLSRPRALPDGVRFVSARTVRDEKLMTSGIAQIHFLPKGYVEQAEIHVASERGSAAFTLLVEPLGGRVRILDGIQDLDFSRPGFGARP